MQYVTMDETWLYLFTPDTKRQSAEWTGTGEPHWKQPKVQQLLSIRILRCGGNFVHQLPCKVKRKNKKQLVLLWIIGSIEKKCGIEASNKEEKVLLKRIEWITLWTAFPPTVFSKSGPQRLLPVRGSQKNAHERWSKKQAYFKDKDKSFYKKGIVVREALECVLMLMVRSWWIKSNFAKTNCFS